MKCVDEPTGLKKIRCVEFAHLQVVDGVCFMTTCKTDSEFYIINKQHPIVSYCVYCVVQLTLSIKANCFSLYFFENRRRQRQKLEIILFETAALLIVDNGRDKIAQIRFRKFHSSQYYWLLQ